MKVLLATTVPAFAARDADREVARAWMTDLDRIIDAAERYGHDTDVFAAFEVDGGDNPFDDIDLDLARYEAETWRFAYDDHASSITSMNRLGRICTGRNLAIEHAYAQGGGHDAILWVDADVTLPRMAVVQLAHIMELAGERGSWYPAVGGHIPTYGLTGPPCNRPDIGGDLRFHWTSAGFLMVSRDVYSTIRWGHWGEMTDDPWFQRRIYELFGTETIVDHSLIGNHHPPRIGPLEQRGHDLAYRRSC